jgi:rare lipoprotein A
VNDKSQHQESSQSKPDKFDRKGKVSREMAPEKSSHESRFRAVRAILIFFALAASFIAVFSHYRETGPEAALRPQGPGGSQESAATQPDAQPLAPPSAPASRETGRASWYAFDSHTANGEQMDADALTAAHPSLPFGTKVLVENLNNGRSVVVRINDRGPFTGDRIIDLSKAAAVSLGMIDDGVATVRISSVDATRAAQIGAETDAPRQISAEPTALEVNQHN